MKGVVKMLTYLIIGLLVQIVTTTERVLRKVAGDSITTWNWLDYVVFLVSVAINVITWPISIIFEICNIIIEEKAKGSA